MRRRAQRLLSRLVQADLKVGLYVGWRMRPRTPAYRRRGGPSGPPKRGAQVAVAAMNFSERVNIGRVERWLSMVAGGALAAYALKRREGPGGAAAIAGAALLYRGATGHCDVYQALGINRSDAHGSRERHRRDRGSRIGHARQARRPPRHSRGRVGDDQPAAQRAVPVLAQLREPADVHEPPRIGCGARRRDLALGRERACRHARSSGTRASSTRCRTRSSAGSRSRAQPSRRRAR